MLMLQDGLLWNNPEPHPPCGLAQARHPLQDARHLSVLWLHHQGLHGLHSSSRAHLVPGQQYKHMRPFDLLAEWWLEAKLPLLRWRQSSTTSRGSFTTRTRMWPSWCSTSTMGTAGDYLATFLPSGDCQATLLPTQMNQSSLFAKRINISKITSKFAVIGILFLMIFIHSVDIWHGKILTAG